MFDKQRPEMNDNAVNTRLSYRERIDYILCSLFV